MTTRVETKEGFLRAGAVLTRSGPIDYLRSEIGMAGDGVVTVNRTLETLMHPDTLAGLRGAPITLGHPEGGVTPANFQDVVVGAVAGEPRVVGSVIIGDILLGDTTALKRLDDGEDELSIGYDFAIGGNYDTIGPLVINHVAMVPAGRAGSGVRIMDSREGLDMADAMSKKEMMDAIGEAMDMGFKKRMDAAGKDGQPAFDAEDMKKTFMDALSPVLDGMKKMYDAADQRQHAEDAAKAEAEAKAAAVKLVEDTESRMKEGFAVYAEAMPLLPADKLTELSTADPKTVLIAALGDAVPDAEKRDIQYLRGALAIAMSRKATAGVSGAHTVVGAGDLPPGVTAFDARTINAVSDARTKSIEDYVAAQTKRYNDKGGI